MKMDQKKWIILIAAVVVLCVLIAAVLIWHPWQTNQGGDDTASVSSVVSAAESQNDTSSTAEDTDAAPDGVTATLDALHLDAQVPYITVLWKNEGTEPFTFGRGFDILYAPDGSDDFESCKTSDFPITMEAYELSPSEEMTMEYTVEAFDLSKVGDYRFVGMGNVTFDFVIEPPVESEPPASSEPPAPSVEPEPEPEPEPPASSVEPEPEPAPEPPVEQTGSRITAWRSNLNGISISAVAYEFDSDTPYLDVLWKNEGGRDFIFNKDFDVLYAGEDGHYASCVIGSLEESREIHYLAPGTEYVQRYDLSGFDLSKSGKYHLRGNGFEGDDIWVRFEK